MKSSRFPDECVAFEVIGTDFAVELKFIWPASGCLECYLHPNETWAYYPRELRPLTPSARAALALVRP